MIARLWDCFSQKECRIRINCRSRTRFETGRTPRRSRSKESGSAGSSLQTTIRIERGRDQGWDVGKILRVICSTLNIDKSGVGAIRLQNDHAQVELLPSIEKDFERFGHRLIERGLITEGRKSYKAVEQRGKKPFRQRKKR